MRINKFVALATGMSRRQADNTIEEKAVLINNIPAKHGQEVTESDTVKLNNSQIHIPEIKRSTKPLYRCTYFYSYAGPTQFRPICRV